MSVLRASQGLALPSTEKASRSFSQKITSHQKPRHVKPTHNCSAAAMVRGRATAPPWLVRHVLLLEKGDYLHLHVPQKNVAIWTGRIAHTQTEIWRGGKGTDGYRTSTNSPGIADTLWLRGKGISALCSQLRKVITHFGCSTALGKCLSQWISSFSAVGRSTLFFTKIPERSCFLGTGYENLRNPLGFHGVRKQFPTCSVCFLSLHTRIMLFIWCPYFSWAR